MSNGNISALAIRHPIPPIVLFIVLVMAGLVAFFGMPITQNPDVDLPMVTVTVSQPGAAPAEIETQVTRIIEDAMIGMEGITHISSSLQDGVSQTTIEFVMGYNTDRAVNDVRNAVSRVRSQLPLDIYEPRVERIVNNGDMMFYTLSSSSRTLEQLSWMVDSEISHRLTRVAGVGSIERAGGVTREIRINLDPDRLIALGVTADEVNQQMRTLNIDLPGGRGNLGVSEQSIRTLGGQRTVEELRNTEIALPLGGRVRLSDLGSVVDGTSEMRQVMRLNGDPAVGFSVLRAPHASEVSAAKEVEAAIAELAKANPDVKFQSIFKSSDYIMESYSASIEALVLGSILAVAVVWLFLRDLRATLISAVAMPLSTIPTFVVIQAFGFTLNFITMLGLALVVGILVDDAIVEIENIARHIRMGKRPYQAALEAADEIGLAVVATTMTIVVVFLPVSFMPGFVGQYFKSFGVTVAVAVLFSLLVARLITPLMAAYLLTPVQHEEEQAGRWTRRYLALLEYCLAHRWKAMAAGTLIFLGSAALTAFIPSSFVPKVDMGEARIQVELPPGATLPEMDATLQRLAAIVRKDPIVENIYTWAGRQDQPRTGMVTVLLKPRTERSESEQEFEVRMTPELLKVPGARVSFQSNGGFSNRDVTVLLAGEDGALLEKTADRVMADMRTLPFLLNISSTAAMLRPEIQITPRFDRAAEQGVSAMAIGQVARIATLGDIDTNVAKFTVGDRQIPIRVQLALDSRTHLDVIENLRVRNSLGGMVPLKSVADIRMGSGSVEIDRFDRARRITIYADLRGKVIGEANDAINALPSMKNLPSGITVPNYGESEQMALLQHGFAVALGTAILLIIAVLVLLFRNFFHPATILMALPLSVGGAIAALLICRMSLSLAASIGFLMLMGIVTKNSILLVEYAIVAMRDRHMDRHSALMDAATKRARPILMTTIAMIAGMLPIAVGWGADSEFRQPMAVAVIGGLITSTLLSLVLIPVFFTFSDDLQHWLVPKFSRFMTPKDAPSDLQSAETH